MSRCGQEVWRAWRSTAAAQVSALVVLILALALPVTGGWWYWALAAHFAESGHRAQPQLTVYLPLTAPRAATLALEARLAALPEVRATRVLAREDTHARFSRRPPLADALAALPDNPFPDAIVLVPADESPGALTQLAERIRGERDVAEVEVDAAWAQRLAALGRLAHAAALLLLALTGTLVLAALWLVSGSSGAVGSSRTCRALAAAATGFIAALAAWAIASGATLWLRPALIDLAALYEIDFLPGLPSATFGLPLVGATALLAALCGLLRR